MFSICNYIIYQHIISQIFQCHFPVRAGSLQSLNETGPSCLYNLFLMRTGDRKWSVSIRTGMLKVDTPNSCIWPEAGNALGSVLARRELLFLIWFLVTFFPFHITWVGTSASVALKDPTFSVSIFFESLSLKGTLHSRKNKFDQYISCVKNETNPQKAATFLPLTKILWSILQ